MAKQRGGRAYEKMDGNHSFANKGLVNKNTYGSDNTKASSSKPKLIKQDLDGPKIDEKRLIAEMEKNRPRKTQRQIANVQISKDSAEARSESLKRFNTDPANQQVYQNYRAMTPYMGATADWRGQIKVGEEGLTTVDITQQRAAEQAYIAARDNWWANDEILQQRLARIQQGAIPSGL